MKKLKPRKVRFITWIILFFGIIIAFCGLPSEITPLIVIGMVFMIAAIIFKFIFYRCPYCGKHLDRSTGPYCPYCRADVNK